MQWNQILIDTMHLYLLFMSFKHIKNIQLKLHYIKYFKWNVNTLKLLILEPTHWFWSKLNTKFLRLFMTRFKYWFSTYFWFLQDSDWTCSGKKSIYKPIFPQIFKRLIKYNFAHNISEKINLLPNILSL